MPEEKAAIRDKIAKWLKEEGYRSETKNESYAELFLRFYVGAGDNERTIDAVIYRSRIDSVRMVSNSYLTANYRKLFANLKEEEREHFMIALKRALVHMDIDFQILPSFDKFEYIELSKYLFFDTLTKQVFVDTARSLVRAMSAAKLEYEHFLRNRIE